MPTIAESVSTPLVLADGPVKYIHVHQQHMGQNKKDCGTRPVFTVKRYDKTFWAHRIEMLGPVSSWYHPCTPVLDCGAHLVLVTYGEVRLYGAEEVVGG